MLRMTNNTKKETNYNKRSDESIMNGEYHGREYLANLGCLSGRGNKILHDMHGELSTCLCNLLPSVS